MTEAELLASEDKMDPPATNSFCFQRTSVHHLFWSRRQNENSILFSSLLQRIQCLGIDWIRQSPRTFLQAPYWECKLFCFRLPEYFEWWLFILLDYRQETENLQTAAETGCSFFQLSWIHREFVQWTTLEFWSGAMRTSRLSKLKWFGKYRSAPCSSISSWHSEASYHAERDY